MKHALVCGVIWRSNGIPQRYPQLVQFESVRSSEPFHLCTNDEGNEELNLSPHCYDESGNRPAVALWGDSHAAALEPGLRPIVGAAGYGFVILNKVSCLPLIGAARYNFGEHPLPRAIECMRYNHRVLDQLNADQSIKIVILAGYWVLPPADGEWWWTTGTANQLRVTDGAESRRVFTQSLAASIQSLQASGKHVIVMQDVPNFDIDPLLIVKTARIPVRHKIAKWLGVPDLGNLGLAPPGSASSEALANTLLQETLVACPDAMLVDLKHELCDANGQCVYLKEDHLLYKDSSHLDTEGARYALRDFHIPPPPR